MQWTLIELNLRSPLSASMDPEPASSPAQVPSSSAASGSAVDQAKADALKEFRRVLLAHKEADARVRALREELKDVRRKFDKTEDDLKALQSVGQIIGEVLRQLDEDRFIVKASSGPRYVVGCRTKLEKDKLVQGVRVALDMTTLTIMRMLPREVDPLVHNMLGEDPGDINYAEIGGLGEQIRQLREVVELPLTNPELFQRVGIRAPKGMVVRRLLFYVVSSNYSICTHGKLVLDSLFLFYSSFVVLTLRRW